MKRHAPREIIDPQGTLPPIELVPVEFPEGQGPSNPSAAIFNVLHNAKNVGAAVIVDEGEVAQMFKRVKLFDDYLTARNRSAVKGLGLSIYLAAIERAQEQGREFRSDSDGVSESAVRMWRYLAAKGIAEIETPFTLLSIGYGTAQDRYIGRAIIRHP